MQRFGWHRAMAFMQKITVPIVVVGVTLSTLHQSSLGSLFVIMTQRLHPLWYTPIIPALFFISSIAAGLAMVVAGATVSYWVFKRSLPQKLVGNLASYLPWILGIYVIVKLGDLWVEGKIPLLWTSGTYSVLYISELVIGVFIPIVWFLIKGVRANRTLSLIGAILVLGGIFLNRFDTAWWGLRPVVGYSYLPSPIEIMIQVGAICWIIFIYTLVGHYLPLFEGTQQREELEQPTSNVFTPQHAY
jgi:Ni/Fe-hydrogenase subunit HybB-like protein